MFRRLIAWWRKPPSQRVAPIGYQPMPGTKLPPPPMPQCKRARDDRMRSLSVKTPERDADFWDIAKHEPEPEPGRVEYRFLDIPYDIGD